MTPLDTNKGEPMKTLPEILMQAQGVTPSIDSAYAREARRIAQEAIAKELMGIIGEDELSDESSARKYAPIQEFEARLFRNELRAEVRARLTAFIGREK